MLAASHVIRVSGLNTDRLQAVWEAVVGWLVDAGAPDAAQDEAAFALAAMARRHLIDEPRAPRLLRTPLLARASLSDAALVLIAAVHSQGAPSFDDTAIAYTHF